MACHSRSVQSGGLDLEGSGPGELSRAIQVRNNLVRVSPLNPAARAKGHALIYPGRTDKSYLFRKINQGLDPGLTLDPEEGAQMPKDQAATLSSGEKELIRQWIQFGAPTTGEVVQPGLLNAYYNQGGIASFTAAPPAPPASEGFQLKMGPFFVEPNGEIEYYQKWELDLPEDVEVNRIDFLFGNYSHHFLLYQFDNNMADVPDGLRIDADHRNIKLVAAVQEPTPLQLPGNTAFFWNKGAILDLNSHYINYSATLPLQAEVYVNVYVQPRGSARHEMKSILIPNLNIPIPNNGQLITHEREFIYPGQVYLWGMMGHTHKYGKDYKVYYRKPDGSKGDILYNASCYEGRPSCPSPFFDYRHIPFRKWEPLLPLPLVPGLIHQAQYLNDGPVPVNWGSTSKDEMMLMILFYTEDSTGITTGIEHPVSNPNTLRFLPNPGTSHCLVEGAIPGDHKLLEIYPMSGNRIHVQPFTNPQIDLSSLNPGLYLIRISDPTGPAQIGKMVVGGR
ncbi:MAG TPA: T9SS type A sorting domain-containing protein [Saprospiraceae bacterium]|nr:T9SS type A sorting domain-containing protein [Saprospiraceae bacterium]